MTESRLNEAELERRMKSDKKIFFKLYDSCFDPVYRYAVRRVGYGGQLKKVVDRTFYRTYHQLDNFFNEGVPFRVWLLKCAKAVADEMGAPVRADVDNLLAHLDQCDFEMIVFKVFEGLADPEAAYILDIEESAFTPLYYRLLTKLKCKTS